MLKPEFEEVAARHGGDPRGLPRRRKIGNIAGCMVRVGHDPPQRQGAADPRRRGRRRQPRPSTSLQRFKDDATEVREGFECGIGLGSFNDIKVDDVIETFEMREKPRA